ncbi:M56 family metallopeptidase [Roseateles sp. BYS180W]|uniref:M56 family metallopeptidase n=1 Tax=Roseateles rivi TaxID=3299028 RepID=A0ABW7FYG2_9BURK
MSAEAWGAHLPLGVQVASDVLLALCWQLALLGAVLALGLRVLRSAPAQWRYAWCAAGLVATLLLPLLLWLGHEAVTPPWAEAAPAAQAQAQNPWPGEINPSLPGERSLREPTAAQPQPLWRWGLALLWGAGVLFMGLRLALACWGVQRWRRLALDAPQSWQLRLQALAQRAGLRRAVQLKCLSGPHAAVLRSPITFGVLRPVVVLPASLLSGLPPALLDALLAHELAHICRHDYLVNLLQSVVEALLFFHPVVWWLSRRLRHERELVADALAAQLLQSPRQLALALQALAQTAEAAGAAPCRAAHPAVAAHAGPPGELLQRVRALLQPHRAAAQPWRPWAAALLLLSLGAVLAALLHSRATAQQAPTAAAATPAPAWQLPPALALASPRVLVVDESSGAVLLARGQTEVVSAASISKLMTALLVLQAGQDLDEVLTVTPRIAKTLEYSSCDLQAGERMTRRVALQLALRRSDNRAAELLGVSFPGGKAGFARASDALAQSLGLKSTVLHDPTGVDARNRSSAADIRLLLHAAAAQPEILRASGGSALEVQVSGKPRETHHTYPLVERPGWDIPLAKTGALEHAGKSVALQLRHQGRLLTVVLLGAPQWEDRVRDLEVIRALLPT